MFYQDIFAKFLLEKFFQAFKIKDIKK